MFIPTLISMSFLCGAPCVLDQLFFCRLGLFLPISFSNHINTLPFLNELSLSYDLQMDTSRFLLYIALFYFQLFSLKIYLFLRCGRLLYFTGFTRLRWILSYVFGAFPLRFISMGSSNLGYLSSVLRMCECRI